MADRIGQQLGNYRLIRLLGRGGFAEVYLGEHVYLKTPGAIKLLHTKGAHQKELDGFLKEAQAIAWLIHPHIVRVLEFGIHEEQTPFLVMDYAPNGTLRQQFPRMTQLPLTTIIPYVKQVSAALQYAHNAKIIHRDVKPENMLLGRDNVLLSDFGIALLAHDSNSFSIQEVAGTATYMAPEQFQGKPRLASDQYALSLVVYEWLAGERPFRGSFVELATQHIFHPPPPLHEKVPTISPAVEHVILRALAKEPQERYASIEEFAKELERAAALSRPTAMAVELPLAPAPQVPPKVARRPPHRIDLKQATASSYATTPIEEQLEEQPPFTPTPSDVHQKTTLHLLSNLMALLSPASFSRMDRRWRILAVFLCFLILSVLGAEIMPGIVRQQMANASAAATATAAASAYTTATNKGIEYGFDAAHTHWNRYEQVINATNASNLTQLWSYPAVGGIASSPTVANGLVYVGSLDNKFYVFDATCRSACTPLWSYLTGGGIISSPAVANGMVYIGSRDHSLYVFDARCRSSCTPLWSFAAARGVGSSPTVANDMVYVGADDSTFYAFDATCRNACKPLWSYMTGGNIFSSAAVANGMVYVGSMDGKIYAFDATCRSGCKPLWSFATGGGILSSPAVANGMVYIGSLDHRLYAFDATCRIGCTPLWSYPTPGNISSSPAVANGIVYVGSWDGGLYAFDAICRSDCTPLWYFIMAGSVRSSPTIANGVVYVGSDDHALYAFDATCHSNCRPLASYATNGAVESMAAVANGVVYVGSDGANFYAFGLSN